MLDKHYSLSLNDAWQAISLTIWYKSAIMQEVINDI